ncbi:MAG: TM0106 family RecB-like putative nuclease [SAR202 cluster bacterium]|nr:TM0106 family RecB-like putative nuclease [SAR202 cluster bacterium]
MCSLDSRDATLNLSASDIHNLYQPSKCNLRVYLLAKGEPQAEQGDFSTMLMELGMRHESEYLETLGDYVQPEGNTLDEKWADTQRLVNELTPVIYQPVLIADAPPELGDHRVVGIPDLLLLQDGLYVIRDVKLARNVEGNRHPEILRQLSLYGWLFNQAFGVPAAGLQLLLGDSTVAMLPDDDGASAMNALSEVLQLGALPEEPYEPVGWSKCSDCAYKKRCWDRAIKDQDVAILPGVDQGFARYLREEKVDTVTQLLERYDVSTLAAAQRPWGQRMQKVGAKLAESVMAHARARITGEVQHLSPPQFPESPNYIVFDIEGMPGYLDDDEQAYLWGTQLYGEDGGDFTPALAGFHEGGDREGWFEFLDNCQAVFAAHGDLPILHWGSYEKTKINQYLDRYGDKRGIALRIRENLVDLLPITQHSFALPDPSYTLKLVELRAGYKRTMDEYGGNWAIVNYALALESDDEAIRKDVMNQIVKYNREDLEATWAVFEWLRSITAT